jgi:hypothetical protein
MAINGHTQREGALGPHNIDGHFNFAGEELKVLEYCTWDGMGCCPEIWLSLGWMGNAGKSIDAFNESIRQSKDRKPYSFYDGPVSLARVRKPGTHANGILLFDI